MKFPIAETSSVSEHAAAVPPLAGLRESRSGRRPLLRAIALPYEYLVFYGLLALFGIGGLIVSLVAVVLGPILPCRLGAPVGKFIIMTGFHWLTSVMRLCGILKCDLSALDALKGETALIVAPNHPSLLDAVLIVSRLPGAVCITKAPIWDNLFLGGGARLARYIRNDSPTNLIKHSTEEVRTGRPLLIFPEGTRTRREPINRFKAGFALVAKRAQAPVQTVFIECASPFFGKGWGLLKKPEFPMIYRIRLGRRFEVGADLRGFVLELESYYRAELAGKVSVHPPAR